MLGTSASASRTGSTSGGGHVEWTRVLEGIVSAVPEPSTMVFAALGLLGVEVVEHTVKFSRLRPEDYPRTVAADEPPLMPIFRW